MLLERSLERATQHGRRKIMYRYIPPLHQFLRHGARRTPMLLLMLPVAVIGVRIWWGRVADRRIEAFIADAKTRGEITTLGNVKTQIVPADQNGALFIFQAGHDLRLNDRQRDWLRDVPAVRFPVNGSNLAIWSEIVRTNSRAFHEVRQGRLESVIGALPERRVDGESGVCIDLAEVLERMAITGSSAGRREDSLEDILDILAIGRAIRSETRRKDFVEISIGEVDDLAFDAIGRMVSTSPPPNSISRADCQRIFGLIAMLLDESEATTSFQKECFSNGIKTLSRSGFNSQFILEHGMLADFLSPAARLDALRDAKSYFATARAIEGAPVNYHQVVSQIHDRQLSEGPSVRRWLQAGEWQPAARWKFGNFCLYLARRRIAASALALYVYGADHHGNYPQTLDALVPTHLPHVPLDPFGQKTSKIGYMVWKQEVEVGLSPRYRESMHLPKAVNQDGNQSVSQRHDDKADNSSRYDHH